MNDTVTVVAEQHGPLLAPVSRLNSPTERRAMREREPPDEALPWYMLMAPKRAAQRDNEQRRQLSTAN